MANSFSERTTIELSVTLKQRDGTAVDATTLDFVVGSIYLLGDRSQYLRRSDDLLANNDFIRRSNGKCTWLLRPWETQLIQQGLTIGSQEVHIHYVRCGWDATDSGELTDPFATTSGSRLVVVTHPSHGLAVNQSIAFVGSTAVGGIDLDSLYPVKRVIDANSYEIQHHYAATSTATGGGTCSYYVTEETAAGEYQIGIRRTEP